MLIYEKDNKLNINFDNEVSENPDLQIGKEDGKTSVTIDGQQNSSIPVPVLPEDVGKAVVVDENGGYMLAEMSGGDADIEYVNIMATSASTPTYSADKTYAEIVELLNDGKLVYFRMKRGNQLRQSASEAFHKTGPKYVFATFFNGVNLDYSGQPIIFETITIDYNNVITLTTSSVNTK
jgi:hypothetical protein